MVRALAREEDEASDLRVLRDGVWRELRRDGFQLYDRRDSEPISRTAAKDRLFALLATEVCAGGMLRLSLEVLGLVGRLRGRGQSLRASPPKPCPTPKMFRPLKPKAMISAPTNVPSTWNSPSLSVADPRKTAAMAVSR